MKVNPINEPAQFHEISSNSQIDDSVENRVNNLIENKIDRTENQPSRWSQFRNGVSAMPGWVGSNIKNIFHRSLDFEEIDEMDDLEDEIDQTFPNTKINIVKNFADNEVVDADLSDLDLSEFDEGEFEFELEDGVESNDSNFYEASNFSNEDRITEFLREGNLDDLDSETESVDSEYSFKSAIVDTDTEAKIQELLTRQDDPKIPPQQKLAGLLEELKNIPAVDMNDLKIKCALEKSGEKYQIEPFVTSGLTCHRIKVNYKIKFQVDGEEKEITIPRTIFTTASDPKEALAMAKYYGEGCIDIALKSADMPGNRKLNFSNQTDMAALLSKSSFSVNLERDKNGNAIRASSIESQGVKLNFAPNAFKTVSGGIKRAVQSQRDEIFNARYSIVPSQYDQNFVDRAAKKIPHLKKELEEIEKKFDIPSWNLYKRFRNKKIHTAEFKQIVEDLDAVERGTGTKAKSTAAKDFLKLKKEEVSIREKKQFAEAVLGKLNTESQTALNSKEESFVKTLLNVYKNRRIEFVNSTREKAILGDFAEQQQKKLVALKQELTAKKNAVIQQNDVLIKEYTKFKQLTEELQTYNDYATHLLNKPRTREDQKQELAVMLQQLTPVLQKNNAFVQSIAKELGDESFEPPISFDRTNTHQVANNQRELNKTP